MSHDITKWTVLGMRGTNGTCRSVWLTRKHGELVSFEPPWQDPPVLPAKWTTAATIDDATVAEALALYLEHERSGKSDAIRRVLELARDRFA